MHSEQRRVVVVTGASSGIGRAAACAFAARGDNVVLAARRQDDLERTAELCRAAGGEALVVVTDVTRETDVQALARAALERFSRIDVWVNNAGVTLFGTLEGAPFDEHRRVIETNLYGSMFGARAAIPIFRQQQKGVLINVGSVLSKIGQAFVPSYVISKFALRGMSEALRVELADEPDIHVCTLLPYAVDTPHFQSGANEVQRKAHAMPPMQTPEKVAEALVQLSLHPRRERHVPRIAVLGLGLHWLRPRMVERLLLHALERWHLEGEQPRSQGNIYQPLPEAGSVHGRRKPLAWGPTFALWTVREYLKVELQPVVQRLSRAGKRQARPQEKQHAATV